MLRRWAETSHRRKAARAALALREWLAAARAVEQSCSRPLAASDLVPDAAVLLIPVDRQLPQLRLHAAVLRGPLRRRDRALAARIGEATNLTFRLRNQTATFLLRAQDARRPGAARPGARSPQEARDRAHDQARAVAHELGARLEALESDVRTLLQIWEDEAR